jgi:integrase
VIAGIVSELHAESLSGWTIRGILVPFGRVLGYAARRKVSPSNPMRRLERSERPRVTRREMRILRPDEINALLNAANPAYKPILATAIFTGLRQGELLGLRWADVDFDNGLVHVRRQLDRLGHYVEPKTPRSVRTVVLTPSLAKLLRGHKRTSPHTTPTDPVFATSTGRPMHYRNVTRRGLAEGMEAARLNRDGEPRLRFHDLRHTYASLLIAQGLNVVFVSRQLGHSAASFTLDVYGGLFDRTEHARRATDGLEAAFAHVFE